MQGFEIQGKLQPVLPTEIKRLGSDGLKITWQDGKVCTLSSRVLRQNCPCAVCKEERGDGSHAKPLTPKKSSMLKVVSSTIEEELQLEEVQGVGNYAISLRWGDGHHTGIYQFSLLRELGES